MGAKSKKERSVPASTTNYGGSTSDVGNSRATSGSTGKDDRLEQLQADHELFLQAFEKPTQIYRFLRTRNMVSPIFLNRNLTFMRHRSILSSNADREVRRNFKVDDLLEKKKKESTEIAEQLNGFMTLTFLGYYEKKGEKTPDKVSVELVLMKSASKKRKEHSAPIMNFSIGNCEVPVNPSEDHPPNKATALSIPSESFSLNNGIQNKSYSLQVKVRQTLTTQFTSGNSTDMSQSQNNGTGDQQGDENVEPSIKRRKIRNGFGNDSNTLLGRELVVYDNHSRCLLTEGEYELVLSEISESSNPIIRGSPRKNGSWENINIDKSDKAISEQCEVFSMSPTLKFRLSWSNEPAGPLVERPRPLMSRDNSDLGTNRKEKGYRNSRGNSMTNISSSSSMNDTSSNANNQNYHEPGKGTSSCASSVSGSTTRDPTTQLANRSSEKPPRIVYQFLYNNNSRQQTDARNDLHCPWCAMSCLELYSLLKHLKLSHPRFLFTYVPIQEGARIDVSVSELYDSTYVGNPHDMISQPPGFAFSRHGPVQRTSITNILVCKPKRNPHSLSEFLEIEENDLNGPYDGQRPFVTGHNRLYHYSTTNLPMPPHAILQPSVEDQVDPPWLMTKICRMIDEFTDVNDGEKEFMKMWNLHVQHYTFVGDCQIPLALKMFIEEHGREMMEKHLYRNFLLHCCNMHEYNVLSPGQVFTAFTQLQRFIKDNGLQHHLQHWKGQQKRAFDSVAISVITSISTGKLPSAELSPNCQRNDFSGIFKKEGQSSLMDSIEKSQNSNSNLAMMKTSSLSLGGGSIQDKTCLEGKEKTSDNHSASSNMSLRETLATSGNTSKSQELSGKNGNNGSMLEVSNKSMKANSNGSENILEGDKNISTSEINVTKKVEKTGNGHHNGVLQDNEKEELSSKNSVASSKSISPIKSSSTSAITKRNSTQLPSSSSKA